MRESTATTLPVHASLAALLATLPATYSGPIDPEAGDQRRTAARFAYSNQVWDIHSDTLVQRLRDLARDMESGRATVEPTASALALRDRRPKPYGLYVYARLGGAPVVERRQQAPSGRLCPVCFIRQGGGVCGQCGGELA